jgi:hypothetical protein
MRLSLAKAVVPVGWPPLEETMQKVVAKKIQIFACGACSRARGVTARLGLWSHCLPPCGGCSIFIKNTNDFVV